MVAAEMVVTDLEVLAEVAVVMDRDTDQTVVALDTKHKY